MCAATSVQQVLPVTHDQGTLDTHNRRATKGSHGQVGWGVRLLSCIPTTVGTPYNTAPYITGSNIGRLGQRSQNSWSTLLIPVVKSAPLRVIFTRKSIPKKRIHGSSDIYLGTQWKQRHDSPWSYRLDVIVTFLWYRTIGIIWHRDHQSTAKKV